MLTTRSLAVPFAVALALTACAAGDVSSVDDEPSVELDDGAAPTTTSDVALDAPVTTVQPEAAPATTVATPEVTTAATVPPAAETAPAITVTPTPVVATQQVDVTNYQGETIPLVIDLTTADRSNERVEITFTLTNTSDVAEWTIIDQFGDGDAGTNDDMAGVSLIDLTNDLRYLVLIDSEGNCVCSTTFDNVGPGQSISYQASLTAPPADVTVVDVQLGGVTLFTDVTLTDR